MLPAIVQTLVSNGLSLLGNAVLAKGKAWVKEKTGVDLDKGNLEGSDFVRLRQFEMEHEEELLRIAQENNRIAAGLIKLDYDDTDSARKMQVAALKQEDLFSKRFVYYFAIFWSVISCLYIFFITFSELPEQNIRFADTILGFILGTLIATIITFFFGTSRSSQNKDALVSEVVKNVTGGGQ